MEEMDKAETLWTKLLSPTVLTVPVTLIYH